MINAFSPAYVETYMPEFLSKVRSESVQSESGKKSGQLARASRESDGSVKSSPLSDFPKTKRVSTAVKKFHIYSKAEMPKGTK